MNRHEVKRRIKQRATGINAHSRKEIVYEHCSARKVNITFYSPRSVFAAVFMYKLPSSK